MNEINSLYECLRELDNDINNIIMSLDAGNTVMNMVEEVVRTTKVQ